MVSGGEEGLFLDIWHTRVAMVSFEVPPYEPRCHCDNDVVIEILKNTVLY